MIRLERENLLEMFDNSAVLHIYDAIDTFIHSKEGAWQSDGSQSLRAYATTPADIARLAHDKLYELLDVYEGAFAKEVERIEEGNKNGATIKTNLFPTSKRGLAYKEKLYSRFADVMATPHFTVSCVYAHANDTRLPFFTYNETIYNPETHKGETMPVRIIQQIGTYVYGDKARNEWETGTNPDYILNNNEGREWYVTDKEQSDKLYYSIIGSQRYKTVEDDDEIISNTDVRTALGLQGYAWIDGFDLCMFETVFTVATIAYREHKKSTQYFEKAVTVPHNKVIVPNNKVIHDAFTAATIGDESNVDISSDGSVEITYALAINDNDNLSTTRHLTAIDEAVLSTAYTYAKKLIHSGYGHGDDFRRMPDITSKKFYRMVYGKSENTKVRPEALKEIDDAVYKMRHTDISYYADAIRKWAKTPEQKEAANRFLASLGISDGVRKKGGYLLPMDYSVVEEADGTPVMAYHFLQEPSIFMLCDAIGQFISYPESRLSINKYDISGTKVLRARPRTTQVMEIARYLSKRIEQLRCGIGDSKIRYKTIYEMLEREKSEQEGTEIHLDKDQRSVVRDIVIDALRTWQGIGISKADKKETQPEDATETPAIKRFEEYPKPKKTKNGKCKKGHITIGVEIFL